MTVLYDEVDVHVFDNSNLPLFIFYFLPTESQRASLLETREPISTGAKTANMTTVCDKQHMYLDAIAQDCFDASYYY